MHQVAARFVRDVVDDRLAEKHGDVEEGGASDSEALPAVPNNVPLVWTQAVVVDL